MNGRAEPREATREAAWELARESPVLGRTGGVREACTGRKGDWGPAYEIAGWTTVPASSPPTPSPPEEPGREPPRELLPRDPAAWSPRKPPAVGGRLP